MGVRAIHRAPLVKNYYQSRQGCISNWHMGDLCVFTVRFIAISHYVGAVCSRLCTSWISRSDRFANIISGFSCEYLQWVCCMAHTLSVHAHNSRRMFSRTTFVMCWHDGYGAATWTVCLTLSFRCSACIPTPSTTDTMRTSTPCRPRPSMSWRREWTGWMCFQWR